MLNIFTGKEIVTDEDYRKCLEKKRILYAVLFLLGVITEGVFLMARKSMETKLPDFMLGFYEGIGAGLIGIAVILFIRNRRILHSQELLHKSRIKNTDERNLQIAGKAMRISIVILLIAIYLVMLIVGLWNPIMTQIMAGLVYLFLIVYCVSYWIISKKM